MRGFYESQGLLNAMEEKDLRLSERTRIDKIRNIGVYLCGFLSSASFRLRERRWGGLAAALFWRLSLRKEDHQRIAFTK